VRERLEQAQNTISYNTIAVTDNSNSIPWIGSGYVSLTALSPHSMSLVVANWVLSSMTLFEYAMCLVAYKLLLLPGSKLHNTFHVGLLKNFHGAMPSGPRALPPFHHGRTCLEPVEVIKSRLAQGRHELLIR
jgi:hypothetical protein